jgi:hypothetical protein
MKMTNKEKNMILINKHRIQNNVAIVYDSKIKQLIESKDVLEFLGFDYNTSKNELINDIRSKKTTIYKIKTITLK